MPGGSTESFERYIEAMQVRSQNKALRIPIRHLQKKNNRSFIAINPNHNGIDPIRMNLHTVLEETNPYKSKKNSSGEILQSVFS